MQPINAPSVRNYNNVGTRNNGFQYRIVPLSFNLQQKGNDKLYTKTEREIYHIGDIVEGQCIYDKKYHIGQIVSILYDEKTNKPIMVYILDKDKRFYLPLKINTLTLHKDKYILYEKYNFDKTISKYK